MENILFFIAGIALGVYIERKNESNTKPKKVVVEKEKTNKKEQQDDDRDSIIHFVMDNGQITNSDVEKIINVSDSTATRYLDKLEKEGKIIQHGEVGRGVFYTLK